MNATLADDPLLPPTLPGLPRLAAGCHHLRYDPDNAEPGFDGVLRVESSADGLLGSGDLYLRSAGHELEPGVIPVFPLAAHRAYLRLVDAEPIDDGCQLRLELLTWDPNSGDWRVVGERSTRLRVSPTSTEAEPVLEGPVLDGQGGTAGVMRLVWVSPFLRAATLEIESVAGCERPLNNGAGLDWAAVGRAIGWKLDVVLGDTVVAEPGDAGWNHAELHAQMLQRHNRTDLDTQWRYHLLVVRRIDEMDPFGVMYDMGATDSDKLPRQGFALAADRIVDDEPRYGQARGKRLGAVPAALFRTAVHEFGHAMGLGHTNGTDLMTPTSDIAGRGPAGAPFPDNIVWSFSPLDLRSLRHWPDPVVRPGGLRWGQRLSAPLTAVLSADLQLELRPVAAVVPIGAPVRIELRLRNVGTAAVVAPVSVDFSQESLHGEVTGPSGGRRSFSPLQVDTSAGTALLAAGAEVSGSVTLLRGADGALFGGPGVHGISITFEWGRPSASVIGHCAVMITGPEDEEHAQAALQVLTSPDALLALAFGGDHLEDGRAALCAALANPLLQPHYAWPEARRRATRFGRRAADAAAARTWIDDRTVMNAAERAKCRRLGLDAGAG